MSFRFFALALSLEIAFFAGCIKATPPPVVSQKAAIYLPRADTVATATAARHFWPITIETLAAGRSLHTHVAVTGRVAPLYPRLETDGDLHIRLNSDSSAAFVIAECIPELPCAHPKAGQLITVTGISRRDPEHSWWEVHPVEGWR